MSRNRRRAVAIVVGALAVAPMVSACAAGQHPQTTLPTLLAEGTNASIGQVAVRNVFVLGPEPGQRLLADGSAPLYASIVAKTPDRLVAVDAPGAARSVEIAGGGLDLPPDQLVSTNTAVSGPAAANQPTPEATPSRKPGEPGTTPTPGAPGSATPTVGAQRPGTPGGAPAQQTASSVILKNLTKEFTGSENIQVTLHFQRAGAVTLSVPVVTRQGYYATYSPAPTAAPSPTASPTTQASHTASAKPAKIKKVKATPSA